MKNYYKIGEISKIYGIGRDSLMYYEKMGILKPFRDKNGYRMYSMNDIWKLNLIKELRNFDFSIEKIKNYIDIRTVQSTKEMLNEEMYLIETKIEELINLKKNILKRLDNIEYATTNGSIYTIEIVFMKERKAIKLNGDITRDEEVDFLVKKLQKKYEDKFYLLGNNHIGAIYSLDKINSNVFNEYKSVFCLLENNDTNYDLILKEGDYVTFSYKGSYGNNKEFIPKILNFIEKNNYKILGDPIEIYKIDIHETGVVNEFITEIQIPVIIRDL